MASHSHENIDDLVDALRGATDAALSSYRRYRAGANTEAGPRREITIGA
jgi:hypothetical protein